MTLQYQLFWQLYFGNPCWQYRSSMYNFCITLKYAYFLGNFRCEIDLNAHLEIISNICVQGRCEILIGFLQLHAQNWMTLCFPGSAIHSLNNCLAHACMYLTNIFSLNYSLLIYVACPKTFTENWVSKQKKIVVVLTTA